MEMERIVSSRISWFDVRSAGAMVSRATFAKIDRARSLLAMAEQMRGHAKGRELRARARQLVASLPVVLRSAAREWIEDVGPVFRFTTPRRARRVRT